MLLADIIDAARGDRAARGVRRSSLDSFGPARWCSGSRSRACARRMRRRSTASRRAFASTSSRSAAPGRTTRSRCWASTDLRRSMAADARHEAQQGARLDEAGARHVGDDDRAGADRVEAGPGTPSARGAVQLQRIAPVGVDPPPQHVGALQSGDGAHVDDRRRARRGRRPRPAGSRDSARDRPVRNRSGCTGPASAGRCAARALGALGRGRRETRGRTAPAAATFISP